MNKSNSNKVNIKKSNMNKKNKGKGSNKKRAPAWISKDNYKPNEFKSGPFNKPMAPRKMNLIERRAMLKYYRCLLDPEFTCVSNLEAKYPSPISLPTKTINVKNTITARPNANGALLISWRPGIMMTQKYFENLDDWILAHINSSTMTNERLGKRTAMYSQVTINNDAGLNGEAVDDHNDYVPFKRIDLPINKFRLVSAKMVITYNGQLLQEKGSIISGQYIGGLRPAWCLGANIVDQGSYTSDQDVTVQIGDASEEMAQFGVFDNILNLPYGQRNPLKKGMRYSYYYYPMDKLATGFTEMGNYGIGDDQPVLSQSMTLSQCTTATVSAYQQDAVSRATGSTTTIHTNDEKYSCPITVPNYIVGIQNAPNDQNIEINIYENYECVMAIDANMIASASENIQYRTSENAVQRAFALTASVMGRRPTMLMNNEMAESAANSVGAFGF